MRPEILFQIQRLTESRPLDKLLEDIQVLKSCEERYFKNKEVLKQYVKDDFELKNYIRLATLGDKLNIWMPDHTRFDRRGGRYSDLVAGLG